MTTVTAVAATGGLGSGYSEESLRAAVTAGADFVGCDAGSTDGGPYFLGSGNPKVSKAAYRRDLRPMLRAAVERGIPLLMGTSGYAGARAHVDWAAALVREVARADGLSFTMAVVNSELDAATVRRYLDRGRVHPLGESGPLQAGTIDRASRIVAQMGSEPFEAALESGAQVVVAGRASDPAIYAALPRLRGLTGGPTWHAAKVLECGAACVERRVHPDCVVAEIGESDFVVYPPNPAMRCTPQSVAAQTLYENADPFRFVEPAGVLDTSDCTYEARDERSVRVSGSRFQPKEPYDVRLEAAELVGYRSTAIGGIRDPLVLGQLHLFLDDAFASVRRKVEQSMGLVDGADYRLSWRVYGCDGVLGALEPESRAGPPHEVGLLIDIVAGDQEVARGACAIAWHTVLHHPVRGWSGLVSNVAFPHSPPHADLGPVYEFSMNHVMALDDPLEVVDIALERVGG
ncbi:acyclic terpene utilization AtuA family protein [Jiangella asiatica]|nr:acyclic terpene utilization AtuA family protein [Jiangella asiatica]